MEVVSSVVGKVVDSLFVVVIKEARYMWNCSENVKNLENEVKKLSDMKGRVQQKKDLAISEGERILEGVEDWMKKADDNISDATEFIDEEAQAKKTCFNLRLCVNLSTLHHYGRMAANKKTSLQQHQEDGKSFETCVSLPTPTPGFADIYQRKNLENMDTQKSTLKQIIEAIADDKVQIVGITGLGGVGKTTLASEVAKEMKNKFDHIEFIAVSQTVDAEMIKTKVEKVASKKIINRQKVLIILDDVWEELKLDQVGIPCGSDYTNCKILLTSRIRGVCVEMNAKPIISVNPLEEREAWTLFERVVDKTEWDNALKKVALEIVEECGGLPLFLQAVAKALRNKEIKSWEAALNRLKAPIHGDVKYKKEGILQLKLSYDYLEDEVAKSCFLLCSMFPEDATMDLESLAHYGLGLGIFHNPDTNLQDAKHIVQGSIETLESSFLLLPEKRRGEEFKMHDLVRDMAMLITSNADDKFLVESGTGLTEWEPRKDLEIYKKISLMRNNISKLPGHDQLVFPQLDTFLIQDNQLSIFPDEFFGGMEQLKVLDMSNNKISSLPQSLKQLTILRLLDLSDNLSLSEISILGDLSCLEILKLRSTGITKVPEEIGQLINLRLLDVFDCNYLSYVAPGVISKLIRLEELYVGLLEEEEVDCKFLLELTELKLLKVLHLRVPRLQDIPEDFPFETLTEFNIMERFGFLSTEGCKRILLISHFPFPKGIMKLIQLSEELHLCHIEDLDNILPAFNPECFDELKYIELWGCKDVRSLMKTCEVDAMKTKREFFSQLKQMELMYLERLEVVWDSPHQYITFSNLERIFITSCPSLIKLFPLSVAQGLVNLRDLEIKDCERLVGVICGGGGGDIEETCGSEIEEETSAAAAAAAGELTSKTELAQKPILFPHLTSIYLFELPELESFYSGHSTIKYPSLKEITLLECGSMKRWSYGENHMPNLLKPQLQPYSYTNINDYIAAKEG